MNTEHYDYYKSMFNLSKGWTSAITDLIVAYNLYGKESEPSPSFQDLVSEMKEKNASMTEVGKVKDE